MFTNKGVNNYLPTIFELALSSIFRTLISIDGYLLPVIGIKFLFFGIYRKIEKRVDEFLVYTNNS